LLQAIHGLKATRSQFLDQLVFASDVTFEHSHTAPQTMLGMGIAAADAA
jgi:enolase